MCIDPVVRPTAPRQQSTTAPTRRPPPPGPIVSTPLPAAAAAPAPLIAAAPVAAAPIAPGDAAPVAATAPAPIPATAPPPVATAAPAPVAVAAPVTSGPARILSITGAVSEYDMILSRVNTGSSLTDALQAEWISLSFFSRKRCVAEAAKVDFTALQNKILQLRSPTLKHAFPVAQSICNRKLTELRNLHFAGNTLLPKRRY